MVAVKNYGESHKKFPVVCEVVSEETGKLLIDVISEIFGEDLRRTLIIVGSVLLPFVISLICIKCKSNE